MSQVLVFGGTTEGRKLAEYLCQIKIGCTVCVASEYGELVMEERPGLQIHRGRMNQSQMQAFIQQGQYVVVVDATHPFATIVSQNIEESMREMEIPYVRLKRSMLDQKMEDQISWFSDVDACVQALQTTHGNVLLTTGSKDIHKFALASLKKRLFVRVLPSLESITLCEQQGIYGKQIIAMQGPFDVAMNEAMLNQYQIAYLVTKESGVVGGLMEKIEAAMNLGVHVMVIGNPETEKPGYSFDETITYLHTLLDLSAPQVKWHLSLIGMGMGSEQQLSQEAKDAIVRAAIVFGSKRLIDTMSADKTVFPYYTASNIIAQLHQLEKENHWYGIAPHVTILFSGDLGFYSGAEKLLVELNKEIEEQTLLATVTMIPGISSIAYLASKLGIGWSDACIVSIHGRKANVWQTILENQKTFLLVSNVEELVQLSKRFYEAQCHIRMGIGYQLSYPEEEIKVISPKEGMLLEKEGLYCCFIFNDNPIKRKTTQGIKDEEFIRGKVPMTKEEVREISISKLNLTSDAVLYDIGSGTGSVAIECALLSKGIQVYAIERKPDATALIAQNCKLFGVSNVSIIEATAPDGLADLPEPTHVFIGGSGGNLNEIIQALRVKSSFIRVVMNAITLETISGVLSVLKEGLIQNEEIVQVQVSRGKKIGAYHMMQAENPVYIIAFDLRGEYK